MYIYEIKNLGKLKKMLHVALGKGQSRLAPHSGRVGPERYVPPSFQDENIRVSSDACIM